MVFFFVTHNLSLYTLSILSTASTSPPCLYIISILKSFLFITSFDFLTLPSRCVQGFLDSCTGSTLSPTSGPWCLAPCLARRGPSSGSQRAAGTGSSSSEAPNLLPTLSSRVWHSTISMRWVTFHTTTRAQHRMQRRLGDSSARTKPDLCSDS